MRKRGKERSCDEGGHGTGKDRRKDDEKKGKRRKGRENRNGIGWMEVIERKRKKKK